MAYPVSADFRTTTQAEYCRGLTLTTDEASDAALTATIARVVDRVEALCDDTFVSASATYDLRGSGTSQLALPARCTAVTTVSTRSYLGALTVQAATTYRLVSSLDTAGANRIPGIPWDYLEIPPYQHFTGVVLDTGYWWPVGPETIQVVGTFGWTVTPPDIKRAIALLVYDQIKPLAPILRRVSTYNTVDATYEYSGVNASGPTGIPDADAIIEDFNRTSGLLVG